MGRERVDENRVSYSSIFEERRDSRRERERDIYIGFVGGNNNVANDNERGNSEKTRLGWGSRTEWSRNNVTKWY